MIIKEIPHNSALYASAKKLRTDILRTPLGLQLTDVDTAEEDKQIHVAAIDNDAVVGTVILKPLSGDIVKFRQMAIAETYQGKGLGRSLLLRAEEIAGNKLFKSIELHARISARIFYEKLGYAALGDTFIEVTVPTIKMIKKI